MSGEKWERLGRVEDLKRVELQAIEAGGKRIALSYRDGRFGAIAGDCIHVGGPLGKGTIQNDYVVCPWHAWMFHRETGEARPGIPAAVSRYALKEENGDLFFNPAALTPAKHAHHPPHPLSREIVRQPGKIRVAGISTTVMNRSQPRYSTSEALLGEALARAAERGCETRLVRLNDLKFRACEGYYSKSAEACTWPCTITQFDETDELTQVYDAFVFWADVILVSTSIRWGNASSLYYKMIERMNCVQNQTTIADRVMIRSKVASFIITGGQDNIQSVVGQMMTFFGELGFSFPQFPFIAHSRGLHAEDMENNVLHVQRSAELKDGARALADRSVDLAAHLVEKGDPACAITRGGRKAH